MEEQMHILVVDDQEVMRNLLCDVLVESGYKVDTAGSGEQAIELAKQQKFSIIITDLAMPGMGGIEALKKLKVINTDICVIVITGYPSMESVVEAMRAGAYDYIVKPFNIREIKLIVDRAVERQHLLCEARKKEFYRELSILDGLTGVYNHRHFYEILPREIERARRYAHQLCLLMVDLDNFKGYNDTHGHLAGDKLLQDFSELLVKYVRTADMVFRYGGDEFAIIYPETAKEAGLGIATRIVKLAGEKMPASVSIGISCFPDDAGDPDSLVKKSDEAMYMAKQAGRSRVCGSG